MIPCKNCKGVWITKNGTARGHQCYKCKDCNYNFVSGDKRTNHSTEIKKALSIILYAVGKSSYGFLEKLFCVSRSTAYKWIKKVAEVMEEPVISNSIKEIEFDEMWHFIQSKKTKNGLSKPWIVAQGELLPGLSAVVMLQLSNGSMIK
jgi:transposase